MPTQKKKGLTLIELLVVISIVALLISILTPALVMARSQGRAVACRANLRQLFIACSGYAAEHNGFYVPGAPDIIDLNGGLTRWHGRRISSDEPFDPAKGPLSSYVAAGEVKNCPQKTNFRHNDQWNWNFEDGCGGYGYNMTYLGSRQWQKGLSMRDRYERTTNVCEVAHPAQTLMFADTAMARADAGATYLHEYSFAEPFYFVIAGKLIETARPSPSIHFRHRNCANIAWSDGHISAEPIEESCGTNQYGADSADFSLGWFAPLDNSPFDLD